MVLVLMMSLGASLAPIQLPFSCSPNSDSDICKVLYNVTFDPPLESEFGYPMVEIWYESGQKGLPRIGGVPPYNVTTREIMIDGIKGTIMNVSRFSNIDDAFRAQKALDSTFPWEYTIDQVKSEWTKFGSLDGKMVQMYAYYNLSERGDGEYGCVMLSGEIVDQPEAGTEKVTLEEMMHAINVIHVTEAGR